MKTGPISNFERFYVNWKYYCAPFFLLKSKNEMLQNGYKTNVG